MSLLREFISVLALVVSMAGASEARPVLDERCSGIPEAQREPAVEVCESTHLLTFRILDGYYKIDKQLFFDEFARRLRKVLPVQVFRDLRPNAEYWIAVPEVNPAAAQARVVLHRYSGLSLVIYLPLPTGAWPIERWQVAFIDSGHYPANPGNQVQRVWAKVRPGAEQAFQEQMQLSLPVELLEQHQQWWLLAVPLLEEERVVRELQTEKWQTWISASNFDPLYTWIAHRRQVFAMPLPGLVE